MIKNIQTLRFFAALGVMLAHYGGAYITVGGNGILAPLFHVGSRYGAAGVDVFFVISGFVIWTATAKHHQVKDILPYAGKRLMRIYPTYWVWLIVAAYVGVVVQGKNDFAWLSSITLFPIDEGPVVLGVSWTLTFEMMFYIAVGATMLGPRRLGLAAIVAWGATGLVAGFTRSPFPLLLSPLIAEFAFGVVLAELALRGIRLPLWVCFLILVGGLVNSELTHLPLTGELKQAWRPLSFGLIGIALVAGAVRLEHYGVASGPVAIALGNASYALYLIHTPVMHGFPLALFGMNWVTIKTYPDAYFGGLASLSIALSLAFYYLFERRVVKWRPRPQLRAEPSL